MTFNLYLDNKSSTTKKVSLINYVFNKIEVLK